jgi:hypothetical protein
MTAGLPKHRLSFHPRLNCTDGKDVFVATEAANEKDLTPNQVIDVLLGATTHEAAHLLFTNFNKRCKSKFSNSVLNVIEDERIEKLTCQRWPGFSVFLSAIKNYYFDYKYSKRDLQSEAHEIFDCFFKFVRYPKYVDVDLVNKHYVILFGIKNILTPYPDTFERIFRAAHEIEELFETHLSEKFKEEESNIRIWNVKDSLDSLATEMADLDSANDNEEEEKNFEVANVLQEITEAMEVQGQCTIVGNTIFQQAQDNREEYNVIRRETMTLSKQLSRILSYVKQEKIQRHSGLRAGDLDEARIPELVSGCTSVFYKNESIEQDDDLVLAVLTDESGSMDGKKISDAARCCIALNESTKHIPSAQRFFYGYTSNHFNDGDNLITVYQEPGIKSAFGLGSMSAKSSNCDGECIQAVADRIRKFTKRKCLLLIISDGLPVSRNGQSSEEAIKETRDAVEKITKSGFLPIQIGIDTEPDQQKEMFKHYLTFESSSQLVKDLRKIIPMAVSTLRRNQ